MVVLICMNVMCNTYLKIVFHLSIVFVTLNCTLVASKQDVTVEIEVSSHPVVVSDNDFSTHFNPFAAHAVKCLKCVCH